MRRLRWLLGVTCVVAMIGAAPRGAATQRALRPVAIDRVLSLVASPGPQYLRTDAKGRAYLLNAGDLTVFRIANGVPQRKPEITFEKPRDPVGFVADAALCPAGDSWVLLSRSGTPLRFFVLGKEVSLPQPEWMVTSVACLGAQPVVAVSPALRAAGTPGRFPGRSPQLMLRWDGEEWVPFLDRVVDYSDMPISPREGFHKSRAASEVAVAHGRDGTAWVAQTAFYNVRRVTASGRVATVLESGEPRVELRALSPEEQKDFEAAVKPGLSPGAKLPTAAPIARRFVLGAAEGPDGALYLLVLPPGTGKLAVDRYSPVNGSVERAFVEGTTDTRVRSFLAIQDGLYWSDATVEKGAWWLPWEAVDHASWQPAREVHIR